MQAKNTLGLAICAGLAAALPTAIVSKAPELWQPTSGTTWQIVLKRPLDVAAELQSEKSTSIQVYDIDLFDNSADSIKALKDAGKKVVCYFSAGTYEDWRADKDLFTQDVLGDKMAEWDELWLNITSPSVVNIMKKRIDLASEKGCDAIDPDNVDAYQNEDAAGLRLTANNSIDYIKTLAQYAKDKGMATGLKNALDIASSVVDYTQFAVNEECMHYGECTAYYQDTYMKKNKAIFHVEYPEGFDKLRSLVGIALGKLCNTAGLSTIVKTKALDGLTQFCTGDSFNAMVSGGESDDSSSGDDSSENEESNDSDNDDDENGWDHDEDDE